MGRKNYRKQNRQERKQRKPRVSSSVSVPMRNGGTLTETTYADGSKTTTKTYGKAISKPVGNTAGSTSPATGTYRAGRTCRHWRDEFDLPNGTSIRLSAYADEPWNKRDEDENAKIFPDLGVYFDDSWAKSGMLATPGLHLPFDNRGSRFAEQVVHFPWYDHDIPQDIQQFRILTEWMDGRIMAGDTVDIGCFGAHGRTGTMLACLLVWHDVEPGAAIKMVRKNHCDLAIETDDQEDWVFMFANLLKGKRNLREGIPVRQKQPWGSAYGHYDGIPTASNGYYTESGSSTRTTRKDDDAEYEEWLRLNTMAAYLHGEDAPDYDVSDEEDDLMLEQKVHAYATDYELLQEKADREAVDDWCIAGPCALSDGCSIEEGVCWRATVRATAMELDSDHKTTADLVGEMMDEFGRRKGGSE